MVSQMLIQFGRELTALTTLELSRDAIIGLTLEGLDLFLTLGDEPHGDTLNAASRESGLNLAPQHGRQLKAHDAVEHTTGLLGIHQVQVNVARMLDGLENRRLGDLVEDNAACFVGRQAKHLKQVPCNGLSLAVFITREPHDVGFSSLGLEFLHLVLFIIGNLIQGLEAMLHIDTEIFLMQIADVPKT